MTRLVVDREIPGIQEAIRAAGVAAGVPTAVLSRGVAGLASSTLIVNLPGSTGGVRGGIAAPAELLAPARHPVGGGGHPRSPVPGTVPPPLPALPHIWRGPQLPAQTEC